MFNAYTIESVLLLKDQPLVTGRGFTAFRRVGSSLIVNGRFEIFGLHLGSDTVSGSLLFLHSLTLF